MVEPGMDRGPQQTVSDLFVLHERLAADTTEVVDLELCRVLLMEDARFPWLILVPRINGLRELHDVPKLQREQLFDEIESASLALQHVCDAYKINLGALGNLVPQLHIHVVARDPRDPAWPGPVWGMGTAEPYTKQQRTQRLAALSQAIRA